MSEFHTAAGSALPQHVHVYAPRATARSVRAAECPDCGRYTRFLCWSHEWHGPSQVCLRCGREWEDGEWMPLAFERGSRQKSIERAKARWRRGHVPTPSQS